MRLNAPKHIINKSTRASSAMEVISNAELRASFEVLRMVFQKFDPANRASIEANNGEVILVMM